MFVCVCVVVHVHVRVRLRERVCVRVSMSVYTMSRKVYDSKGQKRQRFRVIHLTELIQSNTNTVTNNDTP